MTFKQWIMQFINEDTDRGNIAEAVKNDRNFPNTDKWEENYVYLSNSNIGLTAIKRLWDVWMQYKMDTGKNYVIFHVYNPGDGDYPLYGGDKATKESEGYAFILALKSLHINYEAIYSADSQMESEMAPCIIELTDEKIEDKSYNSLGEVLEKLKEKINSFRVVYRDQKRIYFLANGN